jgi:hypothetical protein
VTDSWRSLIEGLAADAEFSTAASKDQISKAEEALGNPLPDGLKSLLLESDGVRADGGADVIWSCAEMVKQNLVFRRHEPFRELYMPFDNLLFFGADGGGDQFAYGILMNGGIPEYNVYRWDHETDGRAYFAGSLTQYFELRLSPSYYDLPR